MQEVLPILTYVSTAFIHSGMGYSELMFYIPRNLLQNEWEIMEENLCIEVKSIILCNVFLYFRICSETHFKINESNPTIILDPWRNFGIFYKLDWLNESNYINLQQMHFIIVLDKQLLYFTFL